MFVGTFEDLQVGDEVVFQLERWTVTLANENEVELELIEEDPRKGCYWITIESHNPVWEGKVQINR